MTEIKDCEIIKDLLPGYVENLLSSAGTDAVDAHLSGCPSCRRICEELKEASTELPSPRERLALDGFRKLKKRTRRLKILAVSSLTLVLSAVFSVFLMLFVIGEPAGTSWIDAVSCVYDEASDSLTVSGRAANLNIRKVVWEVSDQDSTDIHVLVYEAEALPFTSETHDFSITIPDIRGRNVSLACPNYDRMQIYSWTDDHYELVEDLKEKIYQKVASLNSETDILYCRPEIQEKDGSEWIAFSVDHVTGEDASWWYYGDRMVTDGDLEPAGYEVWVTLEEPHEIWIYNYTNGTFQRNDSM